MTVAGIETGSVFRKVVPWGNVSKRVLDSKTVNDIVKRRAVLAGLEPGEFSAHRLRSGYLTEAANRGIPLPEAMEQSRHRSVQQASSYYTMPLAVAAVRQGFCEFDLFPSFSHGMQS